MLRVGIYLIFYFMKKILKDERSKKCMTFQQMKETLKNTPKPKFIWNGIKENSCGIIFGPSKSGKTIFCENLAMSIAVGRKEFFDYKLPGEPMKILFLGLEEYITERFERNKKQYDLLGDEEKLLLEENYLYQPLEFTRFIKNQEQWQGLSDIIEDSEAKIIFIDSLTRMNHGKLENSDTVETIMQNLREISNSLKVTLVCIHHTPKIGDSEINMDSMKGSSTFSQESDFAIAIRRSNKDFRYMKNVFFRYTSDDFEFVNLFEFDPYLWANKIDEVDEVEILSRSDRRRDNTKRDYIENYINSDTSSTFLTSNLITHFSSELNIKERQIKAYLSELTSNNKISSDKQGVYKSINFNEGEQNEAEL